MLHEVLLALLGHPGSIIREEKLTTPTPTTASRSSTFRVPDSITFLNPTERAAINRVVGLGNTYRDLRRFIRPLPPTWSPDAQKSPDNAAGAGLYMRALKLGVEELLDEYGGRIAEIERDVMEDPTLTLARIQAGVREYQAVLPAVAEACFAVAGNGEAAPLKGAQLLEVLNERSHFGAPDVRQRLCRIVWHCSQVLINQCISWLLHGLLVDPYQEFFIHRNKDPIGSAALRSGVLAASSLPLGLPDAVDAHGMVTGEEGTRGGIAESASVSWRAEEEWNSTYTLRPSMVPNSFVPHRLALKMLFVGKVVRVLRQANPSDQGAPSTAGGCPSAYAEPWSSKRSSPTLMMEAGRCGDIDTLNVGVSEADVVELTRQWTELRMRDAFHLLSLERAVHQAHSLVDRRLYRLLVNFADLGRHFSNLKGLFLMGHGALFHSLFDKAREAMRSTAGDRAVIDLNTWLAAAVEDQEAEESSCKSSSKNNRISRDAQSAPSTLDIVRLDLDPPGFACKTFHDLKRQGFCLTGNAAHVPARNSVHLCPGGSCGGGTSPKATPTTSPSRPSKGLLGSGSLWFVSGREVARGFSTVVAFRCDRAKPTSPANRRSAAIEQRHDGGGRDDVAERGKCGRISFVIHNHRTALSGDGGGDMAAGRSGPAIVPNSLFVCLAVDGAGGGEVSLRWNPHRGPLLDEPMELGWGKDPRGFPAREDAVRILGRTALPPTCGLSVGQVNYLIVDIVPKTVVRARGRDEGSGQSRTSESRLLVYVNDPGRSGSAALSLDLDLWTLIEMGGGRAFVGVSAAGPWRTTLKQWDFHTGGTRGQDTTGPLGGVRSGPKVEEMLAAMDSWSGLLLHYRLEWPLHLVLTQETMQTYNRLFQTLAKVKRANLELERVWPTLMQSRYRCLPIEEKAWLGPLWMLRARMAFFVSNLLFYLQVDVVEAAYSALQNTLAGVEDFVTLQRAHHQFLSTLRAKFYVDNLKISQGMDRALQHVLRFCCFFSLHGNAKDIHVDEVESLQQAFLDEMALLFPVLERLAKELAMRLDFNGYLSAQVL